MVYSTRHAVTKAQRVKSTNRCRQIPAVSWFYAEWEFVEAFPGLGIAYDSRMRAVFGPAERVDGQASTGVWNEVGVSNVAEDGDEGEDFHVGFGCMRSIRVIVDVWKMIRGSRRWSVVVWVCRGTIWIKEDLEEAVVGFLLVVEGFVYWYGLNTSISLDFISVRLLDSIPCDRSHIIVNRLPSYTNGKAMWSKALNSTNISPIHHVLHKTSLLRYIALGLMSMAMNFWQRWEKRIVWSGASSIWNWRASLPRDFDIFLFKIGTEYEFTNWSWQWKTCKQRKRKPRNVMQIQIWPWLPTWNKLRNQYLQITNRHYHFPPKPGTTFPTPSISLIEAAH